MTLALESLRNSMEGSAPALIATCSPDGAPNVSYLSAVHYIDSRHIALSFQFFSKTRANVLVNPFARILTVDPATTKRYRLLVQYLRTEESGPVFEKIGAKLTGIASHTGMDKVFQLRGADIYRVLAIDETKGLSLPPPPAHNSLPSLREVIATISRAPSLEALFDLTLSALARFFEIEHSMILLRDEAQERLFIVATRGYVSEHIGGEVAVGQGVIGVAAKTGVPIRISHALAEHSYAQVVRSQAEALAANAELAEAIPFHGLSQPGSQLALPIRVQAKVVGVLFVEDEKAQRFCYNDEDALATVVDVIALAMHRFQEEAGDSQDEIDNSPKTSAFSEREIIVKFYERLSTVFFNEQYVIKGIAGAVLWKLLQEYQRSGRQEFSSRELRADSSLNLPDIADNLAARLLLLQRRLDDMDAGIYLRKSGRGRVWLDVHHRIALQQEANA